jgi:hypothetical protein
MRIRINERYLGLHRINERYIGLIA